MIIFLYQLIWVVLENGHKVVVVTVIFAVVDTLCVSTTFTNS